jgi:hypothetical protein
MRRMFRSSLIVCAVVGAGLLASTVAGVAKDKDDEKGKKDDPRIHRGFEIVPPGVTLDFSKKDRDLVGLGSYFVNAASGCFECHTNPPYVAGGDPFMGEPKHVNAQNYLAGGQSFGPFTSRNITPNPISGRPADLTFGQFKEVLRHGTDFDNAHPQFGPLLQVMPWPVYQELTEHDLRAIYEFLSAVPHAEPGP